VRLEEFEARIRAMEGWRAEKAGEERRLSMNSYWPGILPEPSVRTLDDMQCVLANPDQSGDMPLYYMYRDLALTAGDRAHLRGQNLRFDITVIPPGTVGGSMSRRKGTTTRSVPRASAIRSSTRCSRGRRSTFSSEAISAMSSLSWQGRGEFGLLPPGYAHVSVNPGKRKPSM